MTDLWLVQWRDDEGNHTHTHDTLDDAERCAAANRPKSGHIVVFPVAQEAIS